MNTSSDYSNTSKPPKLRILLVVLILRYTIKGFTVNDIDKLHRYLTSSIYFSHITLRTIKKYLFYLIEYDLILYDGTNHLFIMNQRGASFLYFIAISMKKYSLQIEKLSIKFE